MVWASTVAGPPAVEFAVAHPELVTRLVLYGTVANIGDAISQAMGDGFLSLAKANWNMAAQTIADTNGRREFPDEAAQLGDWFFQSVSAEVYVARSESSAAGRDASKLLPQVKAPTLVLHRIADPIIPFSAGQKLAAGIPGARFVPLEGKGHLFCLGDYSRILASIDALLGDRATAGPTAAPEPSAAERGGGMATVLFTDLVGHTEMMSRLGDARGRAVLREHERITREVLKAHVGTEVKTMGDGFMASFGSVTKAVECAVALQRAFDVRNRGAGVNRGVGASHPDGSPDQAMTPETRSTSESEGKPGDSPLRASASGQTLIEPLNVRVGLNAGEPIEEHGDLFGATVILASRIAAKAESGEILVADTVRGLCSGKGFLFADRGEFTAKGFEDPVHIYEANWRT